MFVCGFWIKKLSNKRFKKVAKRLTGNLFGHLFKRFKKVAKRLTGNLFGNLFPIGKGCEKVDRQPFRQPFQELPGHLFGNLFPIGKGCEKVDPATFSATFSKRVRKVGKLKKLPNLKS